MPNEQIVAILVAERDRLSRAIEALQGSTKRRGRQSEAETTPTKTQAKAAAGRKRKLSAAGREAIAEAARRRWAAIRAGKAQSPFAQVTKEVAGPSFSDRVNLERPGIIMAAR